jgi:hypothetical protein
MPRLLMRCFAVSLIQMTIDTHRFSLPSGGPEASRILPTIAHANQCWRPIALGRAGAAKHPGRLDNHGHKRYPNRRSVQPLAGRSISRNSLTTTTSGPRRRAAFAACQRGRGRRGGDSPYGQVGADSATAFQVILTGRATSVPFTTATTGSKRTTTDNTEAASTCAVHCVTEPRRME